MTTKMVIIFFFFFLLSTCLSLEDVHLIEFKESLKDSTSLNSSWIKGSNPCLWRGVDCSESDGKSVSGLKLMSLGLSGVSLDMDIDALRNLQHLRLLSLENNSFSGPIPKFNQLTSLKSLFLSSNQFSGEIPHDFFAKMGSLKRLHLSKNNFSGEIPDSLKGLDYLMEMMLQQNQFSGHVPSFEQKSLKTIDLSYNKLEGEIPKNMSRFPAKAFEGNADVCGDAIARKCPQASAASSSSATKWILLCIVVAILLVIILFKSKKNDDPHDQEFRVLGRDNIDEVVMTSRRTMSSSSRRGYYSNNESVGGRSRSSSSKRLGGKAANNDLVVINEEKGVFGLHDLMKAGAEVLGNGGMGSAYKAEMAIGLTVVVKRMKDLNKLNRDAFESEIRRLGRIRHRNVLPPLAYHYRREEKLLVTEFIPNGSLLFLLHGDRGIGHAELDWSTRLKIIKGVGRGMGFLHTELGNYEVPHGNLKSSNILLSPNYEPLLTDYALYPLVSNPQSVQALFAYKCPEAVLYQQLSPKSDVYCLGIVILEIMTGKFPSQYLNNHKGGTNVVQWVREAISDGRVSQLIDPEISNASNSLQEMEKMLLIGATCTESDPETRIEMREALRSIEEVQV